MGCRDDWYDQIDAKNFTLKKLGEKFEIWKWEIVDTVDCLNAFLKESKQVFPKELMQCFEVAQRYIPDPDKVKWNEQNVSSGENFSSDIKLDQLDKRVEWYSKLAKDLEVSLCIMRTWLMQHYLPYEKKIPNELALQLERERRLHALHRKTETTEALTKLKNGIDHSRFKIKELETAIASYLKLNDPTHDERIQKCKTSIEEFKMKISESEQRIIEIQSVADYWRIVEREK